MLLSGVRDFLCGLVLGDVKKLLWDRQREREGAVNIFYALILRKMRKMHIEMLTKTRNKNIIIVWFYTESAEWRWENVARI